MIAPINRIIDSSVVDGPGNRTAIFFQGCNFNCWYCHNPETLHMCTHCGECVNYCPSKALRRINNKVIYDANLCQQCDQCIKTCKYQASPKIVWMTVDEIVARVTNNLPFIRGITCSGGECTLHAKFIQELFSRLRQKDLSCLLDSNGGVVDFEKEPELMAVTDGVMLDIKSMNLDLHRQLTGKSNDLVLKNAEYLASIHKLVEIRTVMTREKLKNRETVLQISDLLSPYLPTEKIRYRLIRFRPYGVRESFRFLGTPSDEDMNDLRNIATEYGFHDVVIT